MILIVDDHRDTCEALVRLLRRSRIPAECVSDPFAAVATAERLKPDLLILDQSMPGLQGTDVLRTIRSTPELAKVRVIFYSAAEQGRAEAQQLGALDWLPKGMIEWDEMRARIMAAYPARD